MKETEIVYRRSSRLKVMRSRAVKLFLGGGGGTTIGRCRGFVLAKPRISPTVATVVASTTEPNNK